MSEQYPPGPPYYGSAAWGEIPAPRGVALLVFTPSPNGTSRIVAFGPPDTDDQLDDSIASAAMDVLLAQANAHAAQTGGVVVRVGVLADHRGGAR